MTLCTGFDLCRAALAVTGISAPEQSVLTVLAIMANDQAQCWPAINGGAGLTGKTKLSERAVQNATKALETAGHITRISRPGRGMIYTVHPRTSCTQTAKNHHFSEGFAFSEARPRCRDCLRPAERHSRSRVGGV